MFAGPLEIPAHEAISQGSELVLYKTFGHDVDKLVLSFNRLDVDLPIGVLLSFRMLPKEVELHCKELALRSDPWHPGNREGTIVVFRKTDLVVIFTLSSPVTTLAMVLTSLLRESMSLIAELSATHSAIIVETLVSVWRELFYNKGQPASRITWRPLEPGRVLGHDLRPRSMESCVTKTGSESWIADKNNVDDVDI